MSSSTDLVPIEVTPDGAQAAVTGTVDLRHGELVVRVRPDDYRPATTRPVPPTLTGVPCMRYVGTCIGAEAAQHHRIVAWCHRHPILAWLRGWTR